MSKQSRSLRKQSNLNGSIKLVQTSIPANFFKNERISQSLKGLSPDIVEVPSIIDISDDNLVTETIPIYTEPLYYLPSIEDQLVTKVNTTLPLALEDSPATVPVNLTGDLALNSTTVSPKRYAEAETLPKTISVQGSANSKPLFSIFNKKERKHVADDGLLAPIELTLAAQDDMAADSVSRPEEKPASDDHFELRGHSESATITEDPLETHKQGNQVLSHGHSNAYHSLEQCSGDIPNSRSHSPDNVGSQENPIAVDSSPFKPCTAASNLHKPPLPYPHDDSYRAIPQFSAKTSIKTAVEYDAPLPRRTFQHIRGPQSIFSSKPSTFWKLQKPVASSPQFESPVNYHTNKSILQRSDDNTHSTYFRVKNLGSSYHYHEEMNNVSAHHEHPAISRFKTQHMNRDENDIWSERWRPRCALEVLGNEDSALYLKSWLLALAVQVIPQEISYLNLDSTEKQKNTTAKSKPKIIRSVNKKRKPRKRRRVDSEDESDLSDWLISDKEEMLDEKEASLESELFDDNSAHNLILDSESRSKKRPRQDFAESYNGTTTNFPTSDASHDFSDYLTNTIIISGPPGSGKTAAVYACAEELGWDVFEVYPGVGKRNGASLNALIGEVGTNHLVGNPQSRRNFFASVETDGKAAGNRYQDKNENKDFSVDAVGDCNDNLKPISFGTRIKKVTTKPLKPTASSKTRQSLILLEEVDILYNDDTNFWPTVVNIIKECRRPVIMTCNDPKLIPLSEIPIQKVISFKPTPTDLAVAYLQSVALQENYFVCREDLSVLYETPCDFETADLSEGLIRSSARHTQSATDVRKAINNLQFMCQATSNDFEQLKNGKLESADGIGLTDVEVGGACQSYDNENCSVGVKLVNEKMYHLERMAEMKSFGNSYIERRPAFSMEVYGTEGARASGEDEEIGYTQLLNLSINAANRSGIAFYNWDNEMANQLFSAKSSNWTEDIKYKEEALFRSRAEYLSNIESVLKNVVEEVLALHMMERVILDYEGWIRIMVREDDKMEEESIKKMASQGGRTRLRRGRGEVYMDYERWISLSEEQRRTMRNTAFRVE